jgi:hypothetical protein
MEEVVAAVRGELLARGERPIVFHQMSVGGFLYGQWLRTLERDGLLHSGDGEDCDGSDDLVLRNIAGQVFDSPPDMNGIADGIAKSMGIGGVRESMIRSAVSCYLRATEASAGKEYAASSAAFRANPIDAPSLWYYSHGDDVSRAEDCAEVAGGWRARGAEVHEVVYGPESPHIQHLRTDPDRYSSRLDAFLAKIGSDSAEK